MNAVLKKTDELVKSTGARAFVFATGLAFGSPMSAFAATDDGGWFTGSEVSVSANSLSTGTLINRAISVVLTVPRLYGLIQFIMGVVSFFNEGHNDNPAGQGKAGRQIAFGVALIAVPTILKWIIGA